MIFACFLAGCGPQQPAGTGTDSQEDRKMAGADRDTHGCIKSAGYSWCARTDQCERPWELAEKHEFENTPEAFEAYCKKAEP